MSFGFWGLGLAAGEKLGFADAFARALECRLLAVRRPRDVLDRTSSRRRAFFPLPGREILLEPFDGVSEETLQSIQDSHRARIRLPDGDTMAP